jgi:hypothetical protein|tara:strand:+ start:389 stop:778 length:390 start_codon:yes stop_codon:yes gene_type:complete
MSKTANQTQTMPNRSQRRLAMKYQGILKMKGKLPLNEWSEVCKQTREKGKEIHEANVEAADKSIYAKYEEIENKKISQWKEEGYTKKEIEELREAYASIMIKDKENWHRDKKIARNTIKELRSKLTKRN